MPTITRIFQIFASLSAVSTTPLAVSFSKGQIKPTTGGGEIKRPIKKELKTAEGNNRGAMQKAVEMMVQESSSGAGDKRGCFWMPKLFWTELFFCFNVDKMSSLFLFHYDATIKGDLEEKLNRVESISISRPVTMNFTQGKNKTMSHRLKINLSWMQKWQTTFIPNKHCQIAKKDSKHYTLTCDASKEGVSKKPWIQTISDDEVHVPELKLQEKIKT